MSNKRNGRSAATSGDVASPSTFIDPTFVRRLNEDGKWSYDEADSEIARLRSWEFFKFDLVEFDRYLTGDGWSTKDAEAVRASIVLARSDMLEAWRTSNLLAAEGWLNYLAACKRLHDQRDWLLPLARRGDKFKPGRRPGSVGPVREAIRRALKRQPSATAAEVWAALCAKPPKGMALRDSPRLGKYIETTGARDTGYLRFANLVTEERKKL